MRYQTIPKTDLSVSAIALGTAEFGAGISLDGSFELLDRYLELGGNLIDTAKVYSDWVEGEKSRSEKLIGRWLATSGRRDSVVISTKGAHPDLATMGIGRLKREDIVADCEGSLSRLGIDRIDLYWLHRDDPTVPVGEILGTLNDLLDSGKIRHFGCSNWNVGRIEEAQEYARIHDLRSFVANQVLWNLASDFMNSQADPTLVVFDSAARAFHEKTGMAVFAYSSQANGFFRKLAESRLDGGARKTYLNDANLKRYAAASKIASDRRTSISAVALSYLTSQPFPTIPVIGSRTVGQLIDSMSAASLVLNEEEIRELEGNSDA
jgi:aryl-alcohol dehydrogenase-like predicted oxidoreductase